MVLTRRNSHQADNLAPKGQIGHHAAVDGETGVFAGQPECIPDLFPSRHGVFTPVYAIMIFHLQA